MSYGVDISVVPHFDGRGNLIEGWDVLAEDAAKRCTTPTGALWWAPTSTFDVMAWAERSFSDRELRELAAQAELVFDDDPRADYRCELVYTGADRTLTLQVFISPAGSGRTFVAEIEAATGRMTIRSI